MFSETELIDALRYSADRADQLPALDRADQLPAVDRADDPNRATVVPLVATGMPGGRRSARWARVLLPAAAAATVAGLAIGAVLVTGGSDHSSDKGNPTGNAAASVSPPPVADGHVSADVSAVVDRIHAAPTGGSGELDYTYSTGTAKVRRPLGTTATSGVLTVDFVAASAGLDAGRIPRSQPVSIAGTTGYYSNLKLFPLAGDSAPDADKYLPHWTIAFPVGSDWAFAEIELSADDPAHASVNDPAAIVAAYNEAGISFTAGTARVAIQTGFVPSGMTLRSLTTSTLAVTSSVTDAVLADGDNWISIDAAPTSGAGAAQCANSDGTGTAPSKPTEGHAISPACDPHLSRTFGAVTVSVIGHGYDDVVVQQVLNSLKVAANPNDPSTYWTIAQAFG